MSRSEVKITRDKKNGQLLSHAAADRTNISGIAEHICAKFTRKTCLVPCSEELEIHPSKGPNTSFKFRIWMPRSKVKGQGDQRQKTRCALPSPPAATEWNVLAANYVMQQPTAPFRRCRKWFRRRAWMRCMFG